MKATHLYRDESGKVFEVAVLGACSTKTVGVEVCLPGSEYDGKVFLGVPARSVWKLYKDSKTVIASFQLPGWPQKIVWVRCGRKPVEAP